MAAAVQHVCLCNRINATQCPLGFRHRFVSYFLTLPLMNVSNTMSISVEHYNHNDIKGAILAACQCFWDWASVALIVHLLVWNPRTISGGVFPPLASHSFDKNCTVRRNANENIITGDGRLAMFRSAMDCVCDSTSLIPFSPPEPRGGFSDCTEAAHICRGFCRSQNGQNDWKIATCFFTKWLEKKC